MFIWNEGALNEEQENAINEEKSVLLIACPGSGKTRTLTFKIALELSRLKSEKEFVVAITYTNRAADEIKNRVELLGVNTQQLWIGTIHSFCLEWILKPYSQYLNILKYGFRVINSFDSEKILTELCAPYGKQKVTYWDCGIIAKTSGLYLTCLDKSKHESLKKIFSEYFKTLMKNNQIDFEQILHYSFLLLEKKPLIASILSKIFPFILIDEYQDTKEIQYHIIAKILKEGSGYSKTMIVGDPNQSIYDTLGGFSMSKDELERLFGFELLELSLTGNYRSSKKIVEYFDYFKTYPNTIVAVGANTDYKSLITYSTSVNVDSVINEITKWILFNINEKNISPNEICIVAPQWVHIASITRKLIVSLPDYSFDGPGMAPFSRDIDNFWFKVSRIALTEPSPDMYIKRLRWSKEVLNDLDSNGINISSVSSKQFLKICNSISIQEENGLKYLEKFYLEVCHCLSICIDDYEMLYEHFEAFFESSKKRIERLEKDGHTFIADITSFRKVFRQKDGITVSTIHGVKGEEYDVMIGFALLNDYVPHFNDPNGDENAKKLLYVLASRARKNLHLISEYGRGVSKYDPEGKEPTPQLQSYVYEYDNL